MKTKVKLIDWSLVLVPLAIVLGLSSILLMDPDSVTKVMDISSNILNNNLGFIYLIFGLAMIILVFVLSISKHGAIKLGDSNPKYSEFSWGAMIVTGTFAADIIYWSFIEWAYYYGATPKGEIMSLVEAQTAASTYTLFHWGPIPWAIYLVPAVAYAYMFYVKKVNRSRLSEACRPILGAKVDGVIGKLIDILALVGLLAGTATTFSVTTPMMSSVFSHLTHIPQSNMMTICILLIIAGIYTFTVLRGLEGISVMSKVCTVCFGVLVALIFIPGPKTYIIDSGLSGLGNMINNFFELATWTDPTRSSSFPQSWTIFYWSYWIAWAVATPLFIGKISEGRSIRRTLLNGLLYGLIGSYSSFIIISNSALYQQTSGVYDASGDLLRGASAEYVILNILSNYPIASVIMVVLLITMILLYSTTFDSIIMITSEYSLAHNSKLESPPKYLKILWSVIFISLPIALIYSESALSMLKQLSIIAAFPLMIILGIIVAGLIRQLSKDHSHSTSYRD